MRIKAFIAGLAVVLVACGGGDTPEQAPASSEPAAAPAETAPSAALEFGMPDWMQVDNAARSVNIQLVAGLTQENNRWNFNGFYGGTGGITVPEGYTVTITLDNQDPAMAHSVGVDEKLATFPNVFSEVTPAFPGGVTADPTSMTDATMPGETEEITFVATDAGEYQLVCYVTGHAAIGMWIDFTVSAGGEAGALM